MEYMGTPTARRLSVQMPLDMGIDRPDRGAMLTQWRDPRGQEIVRAIKVAPVLGERDDLAQVATQRRQFLLGAALHDVLRPHGGRECEGHVRRDLHRVCHLQRTVETYFGEMLRVAS